MEENEIKAILKAIETCEWERDHWGKPPCDQCDRYPQVVTKTTAEKDSICCQCITQEIARKEKVELKIKKWKNKLKEKINMFTIQIDREVLDFASAAFIMQTLLTAIDEAREKLNEKV